MKTTKAFVISWSYDDSSGYGIVGVYTDEDLANHILEGLQNSDLMQNKIFVKIETTLIEI